MKAEEGDTSRLVGLVRAVIGNTLIVADGPVLRDRAGIGARLVRLDESRVDGGSLHFGRGGRGGGGRRSSSIPAGPGVLPRDLLAVDDGIDNIPYCALLNLVMVVKFLVEVVVAMTFGVQPGLLAFLAGLGVVDGEGLELDGAPEMNRQLHKVNRRMQYDRVFSRPTSSSKGAMGPE